MLAVRAFSRRFSALSFQARPSNPKTGRPFLVDEWCPKADLRLQVELAQPADFSLVREFMLNEARPRDAAALTGKKPEVEIEGFLSDMADRSTRTPTTALIFRKGSSELLGIVAGSVKELPDTRTRQKFAIPADCKELVDESKGNSRVEQRIYALCTLLFSVVPPHIPLEHRHMICGELSGICAKYDRRLLLPVFHLLSEYFARSGFRFVDTICTSRAMRRSSEKLGSRALHEVRYDQFLDDGEQCFGGPEDGQEVATLMLADLERIGLGVSRPYK